MHLQWNLLIFLLLSICFIEDSALGKPGKRGAMSPVAMGHYGPYGALRDDPVTLDNVIGELDTIMGHTSSRVGPLAIILQRDGRTIYQRGFRGATERTPFSIASGSKWLIAAAIMTLVDDGLLSLDDTVGQYLSSFTGDKAGITLRQLISHTSGLPARLKNKNTRPADLAKSVDQLGRRTRLAAAPGTRFCYGNLSFQVAARVAEVATGKPWYRVFDERIAGPLGLRNTTFPEHGLGHGINAARASVADYAAFLDMFRKGGVSASGVRVLSSEAVSEMTKSNTTGLEMSCVNMIRHGQMGRTEYGLGVWRERVDPVTHVPAAVSHFGFPGFRSVVNYRQNYIMVLAVQGKNPGAKKYLAKRFVKTLTVVDRFFPNP
jgi:CubicO group peptidase (beta-lactamase class C family)